MYTIEVLFKIISGDLQPSRNSEYSKTSWELSKSFKGLTSQKYSIVYFFKYSWYTISVSGPHIYILYNVITSLSPGITCHCATYNIIDYMPLCLFYPSPRPSPLSQPSLWYVSVSPFWFGLVCSLIFRIRIQVKETRWYLSLSDLCHLARYLFKVELPQQ